MLLPGKACLHLYPLNPFVVDSDGMKEQSGLIVSQAYVVMVQHLIECCIELHMDRDTCLRSLAKDARVNPVITLTVWNELERENPDFFRAYAAQCAHMRARLHRHRLNKAAARLCQTCRLKVSQCEQCSDVMHDVSMHKADSMHDVAASAASSLTRQCTWPSTSATPAAAVAESSGVLEGAVGADECLSPLSGSAPSSSPPFSPSPLPQAFTSFVSERVGESQREEQEAGTGATTAAAAAVTATTGALAATAAAATVATTAGGAGAVAALGGGAQHPRGIDEQPECASMAVG
eukprot:TRINITY_DN10_c0_g1_i1.p1 TRINITY_DN10_c0_g1~~TRINITY_DN10_c0_g1_i1.p1  ORF type:complete len:292 (+),score=56.40 TRINITY_DN10_c0_g1_i1:274-1149(+)